MSQTHYSEADLLETYYMQPGESLPVMMHLADCTDCAARYERLEAKLRGTAAACAHDEQPETFWTRQRHAILRRVAKVDRPLPMWRIAAAVLLAFLLGSLVTRQSVTKKPLPAPVQQQQQVVTAPAAAPAVPLETLVSDPWESDELKDFESMVAWESWVEPQNTTGDRS